MKYSHSKNGALFLTLLLILATFALARNSAAEESPEGPEEFGARYVAAFNSSNAEALKQLHYPGSVSSQLKDMIDSLTSAEMTAGLKYTKIEVLPVPKELLSTYEAPDGTKYKFNLPPTNMIKISASQKDSNGSSNTTSTFPIGLKDGKYYVVDPEPIQPAKQDK